MKKRSKHLLVCSVALSFLCAVTLNCADAAYVAPPSYSNVIDGNNGGQRLETGSNLDSYHFSNLSPASDGESGGALDFTGYNLKNSLFENNSANSGGALNAWGEMPMLNNVRFVSNSAAYLGGALRFAGNGSFMMQQINHSVFENNYAGTRGGAIHISGNPYITHIMNTNFINNKAGQQGGAIYYAPSTASSKLRIEAGDGGTYYFSGNKQNVEYGDEYAKSNALFIERGTVELKTQNSETSKLVFDDGIEGSGIDNAKLQIISMGGGDIELNNEIKNVSLTHKSGTLVLNGSNMLAEGASILNNVDLTFAPDGESDIRFDIANGKIDNLNIRNLNIQNTNGEQKMTIAFDADLKEGQSDLFNVSGQMTGGIDFDSDHFEVNILENGDAEGFQLFNKITNGFRFDGELVQYNESMKYILSVGENGFINVKKDMANGLPEAITSEEAVREYKASPGMNVLLSDALGAMTGESLRINMNGNDLDACGNSGILVSEGQKLELKSGNTIHNFYSTSNGAVVNNTGGDVIVTDSTIMNNTSEGKGGAIYSNGGNVIINADTRDVVFKENIANNASAVERMAAPNGNDIHLDSAAMTVNGSRNTVFESGISGDGSIQKNGTGTMVLGGNNASYTGDVYYNGGMTQLQSGASYFNAQNTHFANNAGLSLINNSAEDNVNFGNLHLDGNARIGIDIDATRGRSDKFGADSLTGEGKIIIDNINLTALGDPTLANMNFEVISLDVDNGSPLIGNVELGSSSGTEVLGPIYKYKSSYNPATGMMSLNGGGATSDGYNPAVLASPIAALIGGYLTQLNSYDMAFYNSDMYMLKTRKQREALKLKNRYASNEGGIFSPIMDPYKDENVWFKPYSVFENVKLQRGPKVSNVAYGSYFGYDSELKDIGHGFDGMWSLYAGYNGSHQSYLGNGIWQNGGTLGATGVVYKNNFFSALTANVGANSGSADTMYGTDNFSMLMTGIASKTGYNWELFKERMIIQPHYLMSYSFVNTFDYTNAAGLSINSQPLNAIQISPGLRVIGNLPKGWKPYLNFSIVWNIMDDIRFKANNVALPEMSVKPYFNYGFGVQKTGERVGGFLQTLFRSGGRSGVAFQAGFNIAL